MFFHRALLASIALGSAIAAPLEKRQFAYGSTPVRGVNLGGWLLLEPWITPSIFQQFDGSIVDEYTLCQKAPNAESILRSHWDSWVTQGDIQKIAANGINLIRIPVGYWAFQKIPGDPYIQGAAAYLETAIGWARGAGLKVWIDLHGAPLGQNGYDNSGQRGAIGWTTGDSVSQTNSVIGQIAEKYAGSSYSDVVVGIQLLNEPLMGALAGGRGATQQYYQDGFNIVRNNGQTPVIIHDGFANPREWNGFLTGSGSSGAIVDHHEYQVFTNELVALSYQEHVDTVYSRAEEWGTGQDKFLICGEWSAAMTDCAPALNGYGIGARYDGTYSKATSSGYDSSNAVGSCATKNFIDQWDADLKTATTNYIRAQIDVFENKMQGWIFWNFKTEASAEWDFFRLVDNGVWPR